MTKREELLKEIDKLQGLINCGERVIKARLEQLEGICEELESAKLCLSIIDKHQNILDADNFFKQDSNKRFLVKGKNCKKGFDFIRNTSIEEEPRVYVVDGGVSYGGVFAYKLLDNLELVSGWYNGKAYKDGLEVKEESPYP